MSLLLPLVSAAKKSHTSNQRVRFVLTVNRLEGPCSFGGLLDNCLRSTSVSFNFERSGLPNHWFDL